MAGVGLTRRKSGNGSPVPRADCLLQIRQLCGFLHLSLFPLFIPPALVYVPGLWRKKRNETPIKQIISNFKKQSQTEG